MIILVAWVALAAIITALGKLSDSDTLLGVGAVMAVFTCAIAV